MDYIDEVAGGVFTYDASIFDYDWDPRDKVVNDFLSVSGKVQELYQSIHIDKSTKDPVYEASS